MALPHKVARVTLSGNMFGGAEIWSTGFYLGHDLTDHSPIIAEGLDNIGTAWQTFFTNPTSSIPAGYTFTTLKIASINLDGHTVADSALYWSPASAVVGGAGGTPLPPQISLVATLAAAEPRGLATKGRMFLPGINAAVGTDGHISATIIGNISTNLKTFFDAIHNDADTPGNLMLASVGRGPLHTDGAIRPAVQIRMGNVYDTQRRRRNALTEAYTIKTLA